MYSQFMMHGQKNIKLPYFTLAIIGNKIWQACEGTIM